jgi:hypothetical protein
MMDDQMEGGPAHSPDEQAPTSAPPLHPNCTGMWVRTPLDGLRLIEACMEGSIIRHVSRRPREDERSSLINSGSVFIYEENASGIKRWTDGCTWSPSRILGNFLIYRQISEPFPPGEKKKANQKKTNSTAGVSKSTSAARHSVGHSGMAFGVIAASAMDPSLSNETTDDGSIPDRDIIGSLVESYNFKEGGLIKKTICASFNNMQHHLVSYYTYDDVKNNRLTTPSQDPRFKDIVPRPGLFQQTNWRSAVEVPGFPFLEDVYPQSAPSRSNSLPLGLPYHGGPFMMFNDQHNVPHHFMPPYGMPSQGMPPPDMPPPGMPPPGMAQQGMPPPGLPQHFMHHQGMPQHFMVQHQISHQFLPQEGLSRQGMNQQGMPQEGMAQEGTLTAPSHRQSMPANGLIHSSFSQNGVSPTSYEHAPHTSYGFPGSFQTHSHHPPGPPRRHTVFAETSGLGQVTFSPDDDSSPQDGIVTLAIRNHNGADAIARPPSAPPNSHSRGGLDLNQNAHFGPGYDQNQNSQQHPPPSFDGSINSHNSHNFETPSPRTPETAAADSLALVGRVPNDEDGDLEQWEVIQHPSLPHLGTTAHEWSGYQQ